MHGVPFSIARPGRAARAVLVLTAGALAGCGLQAPHRAATPAAGATQGSTPVLPGQAPLPGLEAQRVAVQRLARIGRPIYCGAGKRDLVALTFDDGPGPYSETVARELRDAGARATFFLVGRNIARFPQSPARERQRGAIGDHTMTHADLRALPRSEARTEIASGRSAALTAAGPPVDLLRPPYGRRNAWIDREARRQGMALIMWDLDSSDSRRSPPAAFHEISARVRRARAGSIVLMHEDRGQTVRALRSILPALKRRGLRAVTVPELLAADPPTRAQLARGKDGCRAARGR